MSNSVKMMLAIEAGKSKGKKILLKKNEYTIGSARKSSIRLKGEFVSPEHAILKLRDEGQWVLQNRSSNQSLVNDQIIDTKPLVVGDSIQIGASNLLKFDVVPTKSTKPKPVKKSTSGSSEFVDVLAGYLKRPLVIAGLTFYLIIIIVLFSLFGGSDNSIVDANWNRAKIDTVIEESSNYLLQRSNFTKVLVDNVNEGEPVMTEEQVYITAKKLSGYDSVVWLHQNATDEQDGPLAEIVGDLMQQVQQKLMQIWHLEQQERWSDVIAGYEEVSTMVPDIKLPITRKIMERWRWAVKKQKASL